MVKNGFLLIELLTGLALLSFLIFFITYYTIEIKNMQQEALLRIEALSFARNAIEEGFVEKRKLQQYKSEHSHFSLKRVKKPLFLTKNRPAFDLENSPFHLCEVIVSWQSRGQDRSLSLISGISKDDNE